MIEGSYLRQFTSEVQRRDVSDSPIRQPKKYGKGTGRKPELEASLSRTSAVAPVGSRGSRCTRLHRCPRGPVAFGTYWSTMKSRGAGRHLPNKCQLSQQQGESRHLRAALRPVSNYDCLPHVLGTKQQVNLTLARQAISIERCSLVPAFAAALPATCMPGVPARASSLGGRWSTPPPPREQDQTSSQRFIWDAWNDGLAVAGTSRKGGWARLVARFHLGYRGQRSAGSVGHIEGGPLAQRVTGARALGASRRWHLAGQGAAAVACRPKERLPVLGGSACVPGRADGSSAAQRSTVTGGLPPPGQRSGTRSVRSALASQGIRICGC